MHDHNPFELCLQGERYEAEAPDTLDLSDRMALAVNALTNVWHPAVLYPSHVTDAHLNMPAKILAALVTSRLGTGSDHNLDVDGHVLRS